MFIILPTKFTLMFPSGFVLKEYCIYETVAVILLPPHNEPNITHHFKIRNGDKLYYKLCCIVMQMVPKDLNIYNSVTVLALRCTYFVSFKILYDLYTGLMKLSLS